MTDHLTEAEIEALAHDAVELVSEEAQGHPGACPACALEVRQEREVSAALVDAFRDEAPRGVDLTALVRHALDTTVQEPAIPSRKAVLVGSLMGFLVAVACAIPALPSLGGIAAALADWVAVVHSLDRVVVLAVPGGWNMVALVATVVLAVTVLPLRRLLAAASDRMATATAVLVFLAFALLAASTARALDLDGEWPEGETSIGVDIDGRPAAEVLRMAAEQVGLGFASMAEHEHLERVVSLHVHDTSLRVVVETLLADVPVTVRRTPHMLVVRAAPSTSAARLMPVPDMPSTPVVPAVPAVPTVPTVPTLSASVPSGERVSFGTNVVVRSDEVVTEVVSMGGDVVIEGEVLGSVVTMGGDLTVAPGGRVRGEIVTWGGDVTVADGADATGDMVTWGGEVHRGRPEGGRHRLRRDDIAAGAHRAMWRSTGEGWLGSALGSAAKYAVLFLVGLLLAVAAPGRLAVIRRAIGGAPVRATAVGLLAFVAVPVAVLILFVTVIGIPAAVLLALAAYLGAHAGIVGVAFVLGAALPLSVLEGRPLVQLAAGLLVLLLLHWVPIAGIAVTALAYALGLGAVLVTRVGTRELT